MDTITTFLELIKQHGVALVGLVYFAYMYTQSNKDSLKLIIAVKDENNNLQMKNIDAIYVLKDEIKSEVNASAEKVLKALAEHDERVIESIRKVEDKTDRVEMFLFVRRGDDK